MFLNSILVCSYFIRDPLVFVLDNTVPNNTLILDLMINFCIDPIVLIFLYIGTQESENVMFK